MIYLEHLSIKLSKILTGKMSLDFIIFVLSKLEFKDDYTLNLPS
jgi:hypothetical protein